MYGVQNVETLEILIKAIHTVQLHNCAKAIRILAKGYLPILLVTPLKLKEILASVMETLIKIKPRL